MINIPKIDNKNEQSKGKEIDKEHEHTIQLMKEYKWPINIWSNGQSH